MILADDFTQSGSTLMGGARMIRAPQSALDGIENMMDLRTVNALPGPLGVRFEVMRQPGSCARAMGHARRA